jgi:lipopolysaccharide assembly outer membrane protein LptD (OstA)
VQFLAGVFLALAFVTGAFGAEPNGKAPDPNSSLMQTGGDETIIDRKTHIVTLTGNAYLYRVREVLKADVIRYNTKTNFVHAEGRVDYRYGDYYIRADSIDVDIKTKTGTIINGNISNGKFAMRGTRIDQVEPEHFKVKDFDYSTCYDCPNAWEITGKNVDMTIEGYAYIDDFAFKVKDVPGFWLPYMVIPIKTKRQSGLLFPKFGRTSDFGYYFVAPYYWAINPNADMTFGAGDYSNRGARFELEGRYALSPRSQGTANFYWTRDSEVSPLYYRWAAKTAITQELPFGFEGKLHLNEVSDAGYPVRYSDDIDGRQEPNLSSDLFFSNNDPDLSTTISFRRIRNLLRYDTNGVAESGFDPLTVQEFPRITLDSNDRFIFGQKVAAGVETKFDRFTRTAGPFDVFANPDGSTNNVIREASRFTLTPNVYTTLNPWPWLSVVPSAQYRSFFYNFSGVYSNLARGYLLGQIQTSVQLDKIIPTDDPHIAYRHTITPTLTYSNIPVINQSSNHPFIQQVQSQARPGQYFDDDDIVPLTTTQNVDSYFTPLGNSLTYGVSTQLFKRQQFDDGTIKVSRRVEAGFTQTLDMYNSNTSQDAADNVARNNRIILSPLFSHLLYTNDHFTEYFEYTYYAYLDQYNPVIASLIQNPNANRISETTTWTIDHRVKEGLLLYDRSISLNYSFARLTGPISSLQLSSNFSLNDYLMPKGAISYNFVKNASPHLLDISGSILVQNPSKCWQTEIGLSHSVDQHSGIIFNIALNVAGGSFAGDDSLKKSP